MDKDILSHCEVDVIETEIEESETIIARIINCTQQIDQTVVSLTSGTTVSSASSTSSTISAVSHTKPWLPELACPNSKAMFSTGRHSGTHFSQQCTTTMRSPRLTRLTI